MANSVGHGSLPWVIKGARFSLQVSTYGTTGAPLAPSTPDAEISKDAAAFGDATEELTTINTGAGYITLTGDETNCTFINFRQKGAGTPSSTVANISQYRLVTTIFPSISTGTASAGGATSITLGTILAYDITGCVVKTTGGTGGGGGSGSQNNQARLVTAYNTSTGQCTVEPAWETNPDNTTTYSVLYTPLACNSVAGRFLRPATDGRTVVVDSNGLVDANTVKVGPTGSGTAQTARDIGASVLLSAGTGTGQIDFASGVVKSDVSKWLGTAASTPTVAGVPNVNCKTWNDLTTVALPLVPTTAGRTLDVSAGGEAGVDWANVGSATTTVALTGTTISTGQNVDVRKWNNTSVPSEHTAGYPIVTVKDGTGTGEIDTASGKVLLAAAGLDSITVSDPTGVADTFPKMVVAVWRRFFKKVTKTSTQIKTYADDGTTVVTTQTVSDDGTTQTQGASS